MSNEFYPDQMLELATIRLGEDVLSRPEVGLDREWLATNGIGGYASASLSGANTRRYHGLLVAALKPPQERLVLLSKLDEQVLTYYGNDFKLDTNEWHDATASGEGLKYLKSYEQQGLFHIFSYELDDGILTKTIWMEYGLNITYIRYTYQNDPNSPAIELRVKPLVNYRSYHGATQGDPAIKHSVIDEKGNTWRVEPPYSNAEAWYFMGFGRPMKWYPDLQNGWYWGLHFRQEQARGLTGANEDVYCLGSWGMLLHPNESVTFVASASRPDIVRELYKTNPEQRARQRQFQLIATKTPSEDFYQNDFLPLRQRLLFSADAFVVGRPDPAQPGQLLPDYRTVIAGYHWFTDWGRDTMIALPGLTISTGRYSEAAIILRSFARYVNKGMLPNRFPDYYAGETELPESEYNTVDAALWYFDAVERYLAVTQDSELGRELYPVLGDIIKWHVAGTRYGIKLDSDGLLASGGPGLQLTWMDVKIGSWVVTPRHGKAVEICALWYRACRVMEKLAQQYGTAQEAAYYNELAEKTLANFESTFWYENGNYLFDCINQFGQPDESLRPNQVIALAVAPELVAEPKRRAALTQIYAQLLTPFGLRTLSPEHPDYKPQFGGTAIERDSAYHQGTVWPWLLGPFARALLNLQSGQRNKGEISSLLEHFLEHIKEAGVGQISEVFSAESPYAPGACIAQAWSVSQLLEILDNL